MAWRQALALIALCALSAQSVHGLVYAPAADCNGTQIGSSIWGCGTGPTGGALWTQFGPLGDWSSVGFNRGGELHFKPPPLTIKLSDYGSNGTDNLDDTDAFEKAHAALPPTGGTILVGRGKFIITRPLVITKPNTILRGEGYKGHLLSTQLVFPKTLKSIGKDPATDHWITFAGQGDTLNATTNVTTVTAVAKRGASVLYVADNSKLKVGQWIVLVLYETAAGDLIKAMNGGGLGKLNPATYAGKALHTHYTRIVAVGNTTGKPWVRVLKHFPIGVPSLATKPTIFKYAPTLYGVGIELLTLQLAWTPWVSANSTEGQNAVQVKGVSEFFVHQVDFINADISITVLNSRAGTITGNNHTSSKPRGLLEGSAGVVLSQFTSDVFNYDYTFTAHKARDIVVSTFSHSNVFGTGRGTAVNVDLLGGAPYNNVFNELDLGNGTAFFWTGNASASGPLGGAYNTFWSLKSTAPLAFNRALLPADQAFTGVVVDINLDANATSLVKANKWYVEAVPAVGLAVRNIHRAQVRSRDLRLANITL